MHSEFVFWCVETFKFERALLAFDFKGLGIQSIYYTRLKGHFTLRICQEYAELSISMQL